MFSIPASTTADLLASVSDVISSTSTLWILAIAIPLGFVVVGYVKGLFTRGRKA